jgi:flavin reductase (DIM6/NTAB) family NADH-FMN oxidoreductase RutF
MRYITLENTPAKDFHQFMLGGITPRPIALVSTISSEGVRNLAPFSYFNAVSSIPPVLMFSVGKKPDGSKKDTLVNIEQNGEFVVNMVSLSMIRQMALTSVQLPPSTDEFNFAGFRAIASKTIKPDRVKEARIQFECKLNRIIAFGEGDRENAVIFGDVNCIHADEAIIEHNNRIDPAKLEILGRLGRSHYTKTGAFTMETVVMPQLKIPLGFEALPEKIRSSRVLTANEVALLASEYKIPSIEELKQFKIENEKKLTGINTDQLHRKIQEMLNAGQVDLALRMAIVFA